jgi:release factor glutamine methyltransferase
MLPACSRGGSTAGDGQLEVRPRAGAARTVSVPTTTFHNVSLLLAPGRVMSPRRSTEQLVDRALELVGRDGVRVADVGTGSGAIAVTLALLAPHAEVWATDSSASAVSLARANAGQQGVGERVHVLAGDLLEPIPGDLDLVLANLPYLPASLRSDERYADLAGEPTAAVFAAGDGLDLCRGLLESAADRLSPGGRVLLQYRAQVFEAEATELDALRERLEAAAALAA